MERSILPRYSATRMRGAATEARLPIRSGIDARTLSFTNIRNGA